MKPKVRIEKVEDMQIAIAWEIVEGAEKYYVYWSDRDTKQMAYKMVAETQETSYCLKIGRAHV